MLFLVIGLLWLSSCNLDEFFDYDDDDDKLTEEEKREIATADSIIKISADSILIKDTFPGSGWEKQLSYYKTFQAVEDAWITDNALFIKYRKSLTACWSKDIGFVKPDSLINIKVIQLPMKNAGNKLSPNNKVCLINCLYRNDLIEGWTWGVIDRLETAFKNKQFEVTIIDPSLATLSFFGSMLNNFSIIVYIGHGAYDGKYDESKLQTCELVPDNWIELDSELGVSVFTVPNPLAQRVWGFDHLYISNKYKNLPFPNTLTFLCACKALKGQAKFAQVFSSRGAGVTLGYDEDNKVGPLAAEHLLTNMLNGKDLVSAYELLPLNYKADPSCGLLIFDCIANLLHLPLNGGEPTSPILLSPQIGDNNVSLTPKLDWSDVNLAYSYTLQVSTVSSFMFTLLNETISNASEYIVPQGVLYNNTRYYWRVKSNNFIGSSNWSVDWWFATLGSGALPEVATSNLTNITQTSATGGGNVTLEGMTAVTARGVCWNTISNPSISDSHTFDGAGTGSFSSQISGLTPNTPYYVRAYATNSNGTAYGENKSFTTTNGNPSGEILPLAVGNYWTYLPDITPQTVTINITGTIDIQGETCYKWFVQGDQFEWYYKNKSDGCWAYGYSGPYQYPPDLEYKYPANQGDSWVTNWIAVPLSTTITCESISATFESYSGCYKYHFFMPIGKENFYARLFNNELSVNISELKSTASNGYDIYQYFVPGVGMVGWENYFQGTRLYKVVLTDYHLN